MQEEGYIAKLLYPDGAKDVKLGEIVAIVVDNQEDVAKFKDYKPSGEDTAPTASTSAKPTGEEAPQ